MCRNFTSALVTVYSCANRTTLDNLRIKQKPAVQIITNSGYRDHTEPLFAKLKIMNLGMMLKHAALKFMHNYVNRKLPISFANTWITNRERLPNGELRNADDLHIQPRCHGVVPLLLPLLLLLVANRAHLEIKSTDTLCQIVNVIVIEMNTALFHL